MELISNVAQNEALTSQNGYNFENADNNETRNYTIKPSANRRGVKRFICFTCVCTASILALQVRYKVFEMSSLILKLFLYRLSIP